MKKTFEIGADIKLEDLQILHPALYKIMFVVFAYCRQNNLPCKITSLKSDRENIVSKSRTHQEGRAFDLSIQGWSKFHIERLVFHMNMEYADIAALGGESGKPLLAYYKDENGVPHGTAPHIHFQVRPNAPIYKYLGDL